MEERREVSTILNAIKTKNELTKFFGFPWKREQDQVFHIVPTIAEAKELDEYSHFLFGADLFEITEYDHEVRISVLTRYQQQMWNNEMGTKAAGFAALTRIPITEATSVKWEIGRNEDNTCYLYGELKSDGSEDLEARYSQIIANLHEHPVNLEYKAIYQKDIPILIDHPDAQTMILKIPSPEVRQIGAMIRLAKEVSFERFKEKSDLNASLRVSESGLFKSVPPAEKKVQEKEEEATEIPDYFICPITQDLIQDPVILSIDGYTYERSALEQWFSSNNTSPMTRMQIPAGVGVQDTIIPNRALKAAIEAFQQQLSEKQEAGPRPGF